MPEIARRYKSEDVMPSYCKMAGRPGGNAEDCNLRPILLALLCLSTLLPAMPVAAFRDTSNPTTQPQQTDELGLLDHKHYRNVDGKIVHSPARTRNGEVPPGASAKCRDGTYSFSLHRRGTCTGHGGVNEWLGP